MKILLAVIITLFSFACGQPEIKKQPDYKGVDKRAQKIHDEFVGLAKKQGVKFDKPVTIGFMHIKRDDVAGQCTMSNKFREVDIDEGYWDHSTDIRKRVLLYHELGHCYCYRSHDYGKDNNYPEDPAKRISDAIDYYLGLSLPKGYYSDGCPFSIMYPSVIQDECYVFHYKEYVAEVFDRCIPW